ncbi:MAG TPA: CBS domain-containing protein [Coriobacteriia bacterium]
MQIQEFMSRNIATVRLGSTMQEAAEIVRDSRASDLMVLDDEGCFVGVLSEGDLVRAIMPRFEELMASSGSLMESFVILGEHGREMAGQPIDGLVIRNPITFGPCDEPVKAAAAMVSKNIRRLPIVEDGRLVGTVSRADIARAVIHQ